MFCTLGEIIYRPTKLPIDFGGMFEVYDAIALSAICN